MIHTEEPSIRRKGTKIVRLRVKKCIFFPFDIPAVEIVSVVVIIILIPTEEMKENFVQSTTL